MYRATDRTGRGTATAGALSSIYDCAVAFVGRLSTAIGCAVTVVVRSSTIIGYTITFVETLRATSLRNNRNTMHRHRTHVPLRMIGGSYHPYFLFVSHTRLMNNTSDATMEPVCVPIHGITSDIPADPFQFVRIPNDMIVKP